MSRLIDAGELRRKIMEQEMWNVQDFVYKSIDDAPTVDAEPIRHGRWVKDRLLSTNGGTYGVYRCSLCERTYQDIGYGFRYCPNCGAKMDEVTI